MKVEVSVPSARTVTRILLAVVLTLIVISLLGQFSRHVLGYGRLKGLVPAFYVDMESNVPTWYSSIALSLAGLLLAITAMAKWSVRDKFRYHWSALSILFFALSMDEVAMIHEYPIEPLREALNAGGALYYTWVIPGAVFTMAVGLAFLRFLWQLPGRTRWGFIAAGAVFVGGAIGVEMLSAVQADALGEDNLAYALIVTVEEFMEMLGVVIFIGTLLSYMHAVIGRVSLQFEGPKRSDRLRIKSPVSSESEPCTDIRELVRRWHAGKASTTYNSAE